MKQRLISAVLLMAALMTASCGGAGEETTPDVTETAAQTEPRL